MRSSILSCVFVLGCSSSVESATPDPDAGVVDATYETSAGDASIDSSTDAPSLGDATTEVDAETGVTALRFAFVGCNRVNAKDADPTSNASTANREQLQRTFAELAALDPKPSIFFMAGDLVLGLTDAPTLDAELAAWKPLWEGSPAKAAGIRLVALPGNHESETKGATGIEVPYAGAEATWLAQMAPYIAGSNGPMAGGADGLATDQSRLTYSFDVGSTHFVVLNTDPMGTTGGTVPVKWVASDVGAARAGGAKHIFAIGHKPAWPAPSNPTDGFTDAPVRDAFWSALEGAGAEAMLAAHNHLWFETQPHPGKTWQIVAGNGGSKLEKGLTGGYFGFTVVDVTDAKVTVTSYGRDVPTGGYLATAPSTTYPTTVRQTVDVTTK